MRDKVTGARRWVVKIGSALLTADGRGLDRNAMAVWVEQMVALHCAGIELVLVSSGAVAAGMSRLGWCPDPARCTNSRPPPRWGKWVGAGLGVQLRPAWPADRPGVADP